MFENTFGHKNMTLYWSLISLLRLILIVPLEASGDALHKSSKTSCVESAILVPLFPSTTGPAVAGSSVSLSRPTQSLESMVTPACGIFRLLSNSESVYDFKLMPVFLERLATNDVTMGGNIC